jgi:hypothetical protein
MVLTEPFTLNAGHVTSSRSLATGSTVSRAVTDEIISRQPLLVDVSISSDTTQVTRSFESSLSIRRAGSLLTPLVDLGGTSFVELPTLDFNDRMSYLN